MELTMAHREKSPSHQEKQLKRVASEESDSSVQSDHPPGDISTHAKLRSGHKPRLNGFHRRRNKRYW
jgi:hypothetical protein